MRFSLILFYIWTLLNFTLLFNNPKLHLWGTLLEWQSWNMWKCEFDLKSPEKRAFSNSVYWPIHPFWPWPKGCRSFGPIISLEFGPSGLVLLDVCQFAYIGIEPAESLESSSVREKTGGEFL